MVARDYQIEAYNELKGKNASILSLPCSMGKTYIASLLGRDYDNVIIISPTRALTHQTLERFKEYLGNEYNYILISVDGRTKINDIKKIIKEKNVISSTFDSCDVVVQMIDDLKNSFLIVDEFHNLSENNINDSSNEINKLINKPINRLFVSATPIKDMMNITNIYTYEWQKAIENKYICDFNIYLPDIPEINKYIEIIQNNYTEIEIKLIRKAYNLIKSMLFNGDRRCICYLTTIEKAQIFNRILSYIASIFNVEIDREQIDCNTLRLKRSEIIQKFKNSTKLFVLLNVHVLDEGIDIPECDSVYITQPNNNIINIVQRMCRANRIYLNKTSCNIYLWCTEKKMNKILNYLVLKTEGYIKNKIYKINNNVRNTIIYENSDNHTFEIKNNTLISYLKKHTNTDIKFIDEYYSFYKLCENKKYGIDVELIIKYLGYKEVNKFYERLRKNYKIKYDFIIQRRKQKSQKGIKDVIYYVSLECFEKICLTTKMAKGDSFREYFIVLRKFINYYNTNFTNSAEQKICETDYMHMQQAKKHIQT